MNDSARSAVAAAPRRGPAAFVIARIRRSRLLQGSAALAFLEYGALVIVAVFGPHLPRRTFHDGTNVSFAGWLALCSLGSWSFLFAWFPFLESLLAQERGDGSALRMGRWLEGFAIGCVVFVHAMLAVILVGVL